MNGFDDDNEVMHVNRDHCDIDNDDGCKKGTTCVFSVLSFPLSL
jgi:hypothetical protein